MFNAINRNEGLFSAIALVFNIVVYIFSENKWLAVGAFVLTMLIGFAFHFHEKRKPKSFNDIQKTARILFIDDKECQIVISLRKNNFNVKKVDDVASPTTDAEAQWANIIFVDYKDVGKKLFGKKEGLGLANELRRIYGKKKRYIIYSSVQDFEGLVDFAYIRKNASYDEFISLIATEITKL